MPNLVNPPAVILVNDDLDTNLTNILSRQLYLSEIIDLDTFNSRVAANENYVRDAKLNQERILVKSALNIFTNREAFDLVIFVKHGLARIEKNNFGPHGFTLELNKLHIYRLMFEKDS